MKVIYDCDNTMGLKFRDIDDGLTLLYLYKHPNVELLGVTLTFGNDTIEKVIESTENLKENLNLNIQLYYGNANGEDCRRNNAAKYIVDEVNNYPNEITLLATGSLKNISDAYKLDNNLLKKIRDLVIMGGITEPLIINDKAMNELNMSVSADSSFNVLRNAVKPTILTGNTCLSSKLYIDEINSIINSFSNNSMYLYENCKDWVKFHSTDYEVDFIIVWDLLTAVYMTNPEIFKTENYAVNIDKENLKSGFIEKNSTGKQSINIPMINDREKYINIVKEIYRLK